MAGVQVVGRLAELPLVAGRQLAGLLVRRRGRDTLVALPDLPAFTELHPGRIHQRQAIPLTCPFSEVCGLTPPAAIPNPPGLPHASPTFNEHPGWLVATSISDHRDRCCRKVLLASLGTRWPNRVCHALNVLWPVCTTAT